MSHKYCPECLRKAKGVVGPKCVCGSDWKDCKTKKSRAATVTRLWNKRNGSVPRKKTPYDEYLASDLWKSIRDKVLARDGHRCRLCRAKTGVVHHRNYDTATMSGDNLDALITICKGCHKKLHRDDTGKRLTTSQVEVKLRSML